MTKTQAREFEKLWIKAEMAGIEAAEKLVPTPMVVANKWFVEGGVCGFAWVNVKPGTSSFAQWLKKEKDGYNDYYGGVSISIHRYGQSMEKKEAHARAMAAVFSAAGFRAASLSRMD